MCYVIHIAFVPRFELWTIFEVKIKMEANFFWTSKAGKVKIHFPDCFSLEFWICLRFFFTSWITSLRLRRQRWEVSFCFWVEMGDFLQDLIRLLHIGRRRGLQAWSVSEVTVVKSDGMPTFHLLILGTSWETNSEWKRNDLLIHETTGWISKALDWVKGDRHKRLHNAWFHLQGIHKRTKL